MTADQTQAAQRALLDRIAQQNATAQRLFDTADVVMAQTHAAGVDAALDFQRKAFQEERHALSAHYRARAVTMCAHHSRIMEEAARRNDEIIARWEDFTSPAHGAGLVAAAIDASGENLHLSAKGSPESLVAIACAVLEKAWHDLIGVPGLTEADRVRGLAINRAMEALVDDGSGRTTISTERTGAEV